MDELEVFSHVKSEIEDTINELRKKHPSLADYLEENIIFDEQNFTVKYIGDDRVKIDQCYTDYSCTQN
jgi:hypothetical protein